MKRKNILSIILFFSFSLWGQNTLELSVGTAWIGNSEEDSAPSPIVTTFGGAYHMALSPHLYVAPGIHMWTNYYSFQSGKAVPVEIEYKDSLYTLSFNISMQSGIVFGQGKFRPIITADPAIVFRIPLFASGNGEDIRTDVLGYFFGNGRFLLPSVGSGFFWDFSPDWSLKFHLSAHLPITYGMDPFYDNMIVRGTLSFLRKP